MLSFARKFNFIVNNFYINDEKLYRVSSLKDLGDIFQTIMKFIDHYVNITDKSLNFITENTKNFEIAAIINLYHTLV